MSAWQGRGAQLPNRTLIRVGAEGEAPTASKFGRIIAPTKTGVRLSRVTGPQGGCRTNDEKMPGEWQRQDDGGS